jgi:hypothetical protein
MFSTNLHPRLLWVHNQIFHNKAGNDSQLAYKQVAVTKWDWKRFLDANCGWLTLANGR